MVLLSKGQDDFGKFNYEMHHIKIQQEQKPYLIYVFVDNFDQKWVYLGGRDSYEIYAMYAFRNVDDNFAKWLLTEAKDFAVSSHKEYLPTKRTWLLKNFNKNEILNNTNFFIKFKNIMNGWLLLEIVGIVMIQVNCKQKEHYQDLEIMKR